MKKEEYIAKAESVHGKGTYDYSKLPDEIICTPKYFINIICNKCGNILITTARNHLMIKQCSKCLKNNYKQEAEKLLQNTCYKLIKYENSYKASCFCLKHNKNINISFSNYKRKKYIPCKECFKEKTQSLTALECLLKIKEEHPYWKIESKENFTKKDKLKSFCRLHNKKFNLVIKSFMYRGGGCPCCNGSEKNWETIVNEKYENNLKYISSNYSYVKCLIKKWNVEKFFSKTKNFENGNVNIYQVTNTKTFIAKCKIDLKSDLDYSKTIYKGSQNDIVFTCLKHGDMIQKAEVHLQCNAKCPKCNMSHMENIFRNCLIENNIIFKEQKTFENLKYKGKLRFDFYIPLLNICIELDGKQHFHFINAIHKNVEKFFEQQKRDEIKNKYCKDNNITLIRISYKDFDKTYKSVIDNILNMLHNK